MEGMTPEIVLEALRRSGATFEGEESADREQQITKLDLFELGLSGGPDSKAKRQALLKMLNLPEHMSSNAMLQTLNLLYTKDELYSVADTL